MGIKQLIINLSSNIVAFCSSFLISFILTPYLITYIGKEAYSFFPIANNFVGYLTITTIALNSMLSRFVAVHYNREEYSDAQNFYSSAFFGNIFVVILLTVPMVLFIKYLNHILQVPVDIIGEVKMLFSLVFISLLIDLLASVFSASTFVVNRMDLRAFSEILKGAIRVSSFLLLFYFFEVSLVFVGVVAIFVSMCNFVIQYFYSRLLLPSFRITWSKYSFSSIKILLSSGFWNVISALGVSLLLGMLLFLTNRYVGPEASGNLSLCLILAGFITTIISMITSVLMPRMTQKYSSSGVSNLLKEVVFCQKILSLLTTVPILIVILFRDEFFKLWIPSEYSSVLAELSLLVLIPLLIHSNMWCIYSVNIVLNKIKKLSVILLILGGGNVLICVLWFNFSKGSVFVIPMISVAINVVYYLFIIPFQTSLNLNEGRFYFYFSIIKALCFSLLFIYLFSYLKSFVSIEGWSDLFFQSLSFAVVGFVLICFVLFSRSELKEIYITIVSQVNVKKIYPKIR